MRNGAALTFDTVADNLYFNGRLIRSGREVVAVDRLGSVRWRRHLDTGATATFDYWPYGQEKPSATVQEREKFTTYYRDATGLDYADQRYYASHWGRFLTADPSVSTTALENPTGGWNRYAYVEGDPANFWDPAGLFIAVPGNPEPPPSSGGGDGVSAFSTFYLEAILRFYAAGPLYMVPAFWSGEAAGAGVTKKSATETARAIVEDWLSSLKGSNCEKYFEPYIGQIRRALQKTRFYDVTGVDAERWVSEVIGKPVRDDFQLRNYRRADPGNDKAVTLTYNREIIPHVLIWHAEIQEPRQLTALLIHEMLHVTFKMNHDQLTDMLELPRGTNLSEWIDSDCRMQAP